MWFWPGWGKDSFLNTHLFCVVVCICVAAASHCRVKRSCEQGNNFIAQLMS